MSKWPASQLSSDDLKNVGQALVMQNSLDIFPDSLAIHLRPDPLSLDVFFVLQIRTWCRGVKFKEEVPEMLALVSKDCSQ